MKKLFTLAILLGSFISTAQTVTNGSLSGGPASNSGIQAGNAPGWTGCSYSPDLCDVNLPSYVASSQVTPSYSPNGGTWLGLASMSPIGATECAQTTITGLTIGQSYTLQFYAACFGTATGICNNSPATPTITIGGVTSQLFTIPMAASTWVTCTMPFTATASTMLLEAKHSSVFGGYYAYVGLDGFTITLPLPVELTAFEASCNEEQVDLSWTTASELSNDYFTIERSRDGLHFESLTRVDGSGTSSIQKTYHWIDEHPLGGTSYYRLSQTDFNGSTEIFDVRPMTCDESAEVLVYPNPLEQRTTITAPYSGTIELIDLTGKLVWTSTFAAGKTELSLDALSSGSYQARIQLANGNRQTIKLVNIW